MRSLFAPQIEARHTMSVQRTSAASPWTPIPPRVTYAARRPAALVPLTWSVVVLAVGATITPALLVAAGIAAVALVVTGVLWRKGMTTAAARTEEALRRPGRHAAPNTELSDAVS